MAAKKKTYKEVKIVRNAEYNDVLKYNNDHIFTLIRKNYVNMTKSNKQKIVQCQLAQNDQPITFTGKFCFVLNLCLFSSKNGFNFGSR